MKKISVIIPIYNTASYLESCLGSVVNQSHRNLEIILVDDGSTDKSLTICTTFANKDSRIVVIHTSNHGVSSARNTGLDKASGIYVSFIDADDTIESDMYSTLMTIIERSHCDVASCNIALLPRRTQKKDTNIHESVFRGNPDILDNFLTRQVGGISTCNKLIRRSLIGNTRFDTSLRHNEDKLFMFEIYKRCQNYIHINYEGYLYYKRVGSASNRRLSSSFFDVAHVAEIIEQEIVDGSYQSTTKQYANQSTVLALLNLYRTMTLSDDLGDFLSEYAAFREKILSYDVRKIEYINRKRKLELSLLHLSPSLYTIVTRCYKKLHMVDVV